MTKVKKDNKYFILSGLILLLMVFGTKVTAFSFIALFLCLLSLFVCSEDEIVSLAFLLMPFSYIFKVLSISSTSFFTVFEFAMLVYFMFKVKKISSTGVILILANICFLIIDVNNFMYLFKLVAALALLYYIMSIKIDMKKAILSFAIGLIVSSFLSYFFYDFFNFKNYIDLVYTWNDAAAESNIFRFTGLFPDPNYYAVNIIVCLIGLIILKSRKEINAVFYPFVVILAIFGTLSGSKSFLLMLAFAVLVYIFVLLKNRNYIAFLVCLAAAGVLVVLLLYGKISLFNSILFRFDTSNINSLTTNRYSLWKMYYEYITESCFWFGNGIGAPLLNNAAAHNSYIDMFYYFGIFRAVLLFASWWYGYKIARNNCENETKKTGILYYAPLLTVFIMYFFLSELFSVEMLFHLIVAFKFVNMESEENAGEEESETNIELEKITLSVIKHPKNKPIKPHMNKNLKQ